MTMMLISERFAIRADVENARRLGFQFSFSGTKQSGVGYVNMALPTGADVMVAAEKAARVMCKRAGAETVTLHSIQNPSR